MTQFEYTIQKINVNNISKIEDALITVVHNLRYITFPVTFKHCRINFLTEFVTLKHVRFRKMSIVDVCRFHGKTVV